MLDISCTILAGGGSRRFSGDKTLAKLNNKSLIQSVYDELSKFSDDIAVAAKEPQKYTFLDKARLLQDISETQCALIGIITALTYAKYERVFVISADLPLFPFNAVAMMNLYGEVVIPEINGKLSPLSAIYPKSALALLIKAFNDGRYKLSSALAELPLTILMYSAFQQYDIYFESADINGFLNINSQEDLNRAERMVFKP
ncbi:MAG: molybdenum cofactor guanylyltransferase [Deferribacteraceae bacterium]|nr:molybdenum cofactor guanylyltransferase [Deferribacteraceae bacterium]